MPLKGPPLKSKTILTDVLRAGLESNPEGPALVSRDTVWSWRELDQGSDRLAANLLALGLNPGDRAATLMPNRIALLIFYLACIKAGIVATPLNYRYQSPEIDHALEVSGASILLAHVERDEDLASSQLADMLPLGRITYGAEDGRSPGFSELLHNEPASAELQVPDSDAPIFIFFTSGSTGKPKGVTHSYETFGWMLASLSMSLEIVPDDILLPGSSISHIGGSMLSLAGLASGIRVDLAHSFDATELFPLLDKTRPTLMCMLPAALFALVNDHGANHHHFQSLRACFSGGDKVSPELEREFVQLAGIEIEEVYGMSEIGIATVNPLSGENKIGSIGKLAPGFEVLIRDSDGNEVPVGTPGRLWVKSLCNMVGYWNRPDATKETIVEGWLDTGDVVRVDDDEYFWFEGRQKQIIVHDGSNICPQEVEESLVEHPAVSAAGVVGVHNLLHGENVRAYITLFHDVDRPTIADLIEFSRKHVGYKAPEEIIVLDEMPLNATGKIDRVTLRLMAQQQILTPGKAT